MAMAVQNLDLLHASFFDVDRGSGTGRRQLVEPGQAFDCMIAAGPATITFGYGIHYEFLDLDD